LDEMLEFAVSQQSPVAIRYPRGDSELYNKPKDSQLLQLGKAEIICEGEDVVIWAVGNMVATAFECVTCLKEKGISATVINSRFIKPFDEQLLIKLCNDNKLLVSLEDNVLDGGMAETIALLLNQKNININYVALGIPNSFIPHGDVTLLKKELGLDKESVCNTIIKKLKIGD
jgi:1-deoxy-D-xylulose-5-phosphate synthase